MKLESEHYKIHSCQTWLALSKWKMQISFYHSTIQLPIASRYSFPLEWLPKSKILSRKKWIFFFVFLFHTFEKIKQFAEKLFQLYNNMNLLKKYSTRASQQKVNKSLFHFFFKYKKRRNFFSKYLISQMRLLFFLYWLGYWKKNANVSSLFFFSFPVI